MWRKNSKGEYLVCSRFNDEFVELEDAEKKVFKHPREFGGTVVI